MNQMTGVVRMVLVVMVETMNVGLLGSNEQEDDPYPEVGDDDTEIEEWEATVLNAVSALGDDASDLDYAAVGEALQYEMAAMAAFGKAKGKSKSKGKGKGKGKGKLVRSNLTLEQRRAKLSEIKSRSKCMRCGAQGHWARDRQCKFPSIGNRNQQAQPRVRV